MSARPEPDAPARLRSGAPAEPDVGADGRPECRLEMPVRWHDIDALGHVNHTVYHELLEEVRYALLHPLIKPNSMFVLVRVELDYRLEVRRDEDVMIVTGRVVSLGTKSVTVSHEVRKPDGRVSAEGSSVLVVFDMTGRRARDITAEERTALGFSSSDPSRNV